MTKTWDFTEVEPSLKEVQLFIVDLTSKTREAVQKGLKAPSATAKEKAKVEEILVSAQSAKDLGKLVDDLARAVEAQDTDAALRVARQVALQACTLPDRPENVDQALAQIETFSERLADCERRIGGHDQEIAELKKRVEAFDKQLEALGGQPIEQYLQRFLYEHRQDPALLHDVIHEVKEEKPDLADDSNAFESAVKSKFRDRLRQAKNKARQWCDDAGYVREADRQYLPDQSDSPTGASRTNTPVTRPVTGRHHNREEQK